MRLHDWNPAWYQPGESLWSVANKLAFVAAASVAEVFADLAGVFRHAREAWLFPRPAQAQAIRASLELPHGLGRSIFAVEDGAPDLEERSHWQLAIRFCPTCLAGFMHQVAFQDLRIARCPVHHCELTDLCPVCRSPLDPLCPEAWTCADCGHRLVTPGLRWPAEFSAGPAQAAPAARSRPGTTVSPGWGHVDRRRVVQDAYEEHSALCSAFLGRHHACLSREGYAAMASGPSVFFDCPLASGALFLASQLGFAAQCSDGAWIPARPWANPALTALEALLWNLPQDQQRRAARAVTRAWFAEVLESFTQAAAAGRPQAIWTPRVDRWIEDWQLLNKVPQTSALRRLAARADANCRLFRSRAVSHHGI